MKTTLSAWKISALVSSLALGTAFVGYRAWSARSEASAAPAAAPALTDTDQDLPTETTLNDSDRTFFGGSKSGLIGITGNDKDRRPTLVSPPDDPTPPKSDAPPTPEAESQKREFFGGSKSLIIGLPSEKQPKFEPKPDASPKPDTPSK